ncbi:MAG: orotidine-5'-phosphate decarboxylase [Verrucomicrobia bacterium]|nr:orotidine-5'-phosphate decarboxylase [Verrucomicrobiota bacterium]
MKSEIIVALDVPTAAEIPAIVNALPDRITYYKIGLELFASAGPDALRFLSDNGKRVFLDLKLHDIPRTVARAVEAAGQHDVGLMTVHAGGGRDMLTAAAEAAASLGDRAPKLVAVTTLTSLDQNDLTELGIQRSLAEHTAALGRLAIDCGIDGLVCSPLEVATFRTTLGEGPILVTPGIRPAGGDVGDQKRVATPAMAVEGGSSFLVVGRPILGAADPCSAAEEILKQMDAAQA